MSTDRGKSRPKRRNTPNARARGQRRLQLQPVRGRYPVLPPVGQSWPIYPTPAGQNFIIPTTAYPMPLISQMMAYNPQTTMHMNMFQALQPPYVTVPTSMLYCAPMPLCELAEPTNDVIAEVLPDLTEQGSGEEIEQASEDMLPSIQQTILYYDPMLVLKICEDFCSEIVEAVVGELAQEVVTTCVDEIVKSYLGRAHLLSASSLERPKPKLEQFRPSTNPVVVACCSHQGRSPRLRYGPKGKKEPLQPLTPQSPRERGTGSSGVPKSEHKLKHSTKEVAEHICQIILDELLFQRFLEVAITDGVHKTAEALADNILNELLFEGFLKQIFEKQDTSRHPLPSTHVL